MNTSDKDFIVAIELGSSRIAGIAGKKKDATMQVLAYAEDKTPDCIRRGVVHNIEKTYQGINNVISKLEAVLKTKINYAYVGIAGQSVHSYNSVIKRDMLTQCYITNEAIDSISHDGLDIPFADYEVLENYPQEYVVDGSIVADPVGVMGTNVSAEFLNVIGKQSLRSKIDTVFANTSVKIADKLISPLELANNILTEAEKRTGCALIDLGAETTTLVVFNKNIVRYLVTIPLGSNNINKDLATLPIDEAETEDVKIKFGDAFIQDAEGEEQDGQAIYTTTDGRQIEEAKIKSVIEARMGEIIANVAAQITNSGYNGKLLGGLVLTGGGSAMKNIAQAFTNATKVDKVRIAKKVNQTVAKTSNASSIVLDNGTTNTLVSLLLAGNIPCGGDAYDNSNMFETQQKDEERAQRIAEAEAAAKAEEQDAIAFNNAKEEIRKAYEEVKKEIFAIENYGSSKEVRKKAKDLSLSILERVINEDYEKAYSALEGKDKFKQSLLEADNMVKKLKEKVLELAEKVSKANKENNAWGRFTRAISDLVND